MMSDIEDTKQCTNCKLEIPSGNYIIHSVHCQRNFYLCSKCEQPVNYSSRIDHDKTNHAVVHCTHCQLALEKYLLDNHLVNDCPERIVKCQICDIEVKATEIAEHENYCGSRTEKCEECGEFVMLKYKTLHLDSNHGFIKLSDEPGPSPSWQYGKRTLCNFMPDLPTKSSKPVAVRKRKSNEHFRRSRNSESSDLKEDFDEISRKNLDTSFEKDDKAESKIGNVFEGKANKKSTSKDADEWSELFNLTSLKISDEKSDKATGSNEVDEESDLFYAIKVSREINSDIWRKEISGEDKAMKNSFKPLLEKDSCVEKSLNKNIFEKSTKKVNDEPKNDFNHFYNEVENVELPCEFCGNLIALNDLILHQNRCSRPFLMENFTGRSSRSRTFLFDEDMEQKIACGMCNKHFKLSHLDNHQLHCQRNPMKSFKNQDKVYSKNVKAMNMKTEQGLQNGLEPSTPQLSRMGTRSEWLSELSRNDDGDRSVRNNLSHPESGVTSRVTKVSRKNRRAPSPPRR